MSVSGNPGNAQAGKIACAPPARKPFEANATAVATWVA